MNERIRLLAEQAKFAIDVSNDPNSPPSWWAAGHNDRFEKFAELIVRECANICFSEAQGHNMAFGEHCGVVIKEHFGVQE